jgi:hypothetical protein
VFDCGKPGVVEKLDIGLFITYEASDVPENGAGAFGKSRTRFREPSLPCPNTDFQELKPSSPNFICQLRGRL